MKQAANALTTLKLKPGALMESRTDEPLPLELVANVFTVLTGQLGSKVADLWGGVPPGDVQAEWAAGLAGFRPQELARGLAACRNRRFAPTLGEFTVLCRPALDSEWAFLEAGDGLRARDSGEAGVWSHPAVYRAACAMGMEVRSGDWKAVRTRWGYVLARELAQGWGDDVRPPVPRLKNEVRTGPPSEEVRRKLDELRLKVFHRDGAG